MNLLVIAMRVATRIAMTNQQKKYLLDNFRVWSAGRPRDWVDEIPNYADWYAREEGLDKKEVEQILQEAMDPTKS